MIFWRTTWETTPWRSFVKSGTASINTCENRIDIRVRLDESYLWAQPITSDRKWGLSRIIRFNGTTTSYARGPVQTIEIESRVCDRDDIRPFDGYAVARTSSGRDGVLFREREQGDRLTTFEEGRTRGENRRASRVHWPTWTRAIENLRPRRDFDREAWKHMIYTVDGMATVGT